MKSDHPLLKICRSWWFGAAIALLAVLVGGWGSLYTREIRSAFPFVAPPYEGIAWPALSFWFLLTLIALGTFGRLRAVEQARTEAQSELTTKANELQSQIQKLEDLFRTQPPEDFLHLFRELFRQAEPSLEWAFGQDAVSREVLARSVRLILQSTILLAQKFDRAKKSRYGANIMVFIRRDALGSPEETRHLLKFVHPDLGLSGLRGILRLEASLSTSSGDAPTSPVLGTGLEAEPDPKLPVFALPVPEELVRGQRSRALPGGPRAFLTGEVEFFGATGKVQTWCEDYGDFPPSVCAEIGEYFASEKGAVVKSFVSVPLLDPKTRAPNAVLNLHRDQEGMLQEQPAKQFVALVQPLVSILERLLARWLNVTSAEGNPHG